MCLPVIGTSNSPAVVVIVAKQLMTEKMTGSSLKMVAPSHTSDIFFPLKVTAIDESVLAAGHSNWAVSL